jgi:hypothetical protein
MATKAQIAANRANARKSSGPRSSSGKARVRRNARRHGATSTAEPGSIVGWLGVILGNPDVAAGVIASNDETHQLAVSLAEAEARLVATRQALADFHADPDPINRDPELKDMVEDVGVHWAFTENTGLDEAAIEAAIEACIARARQDFYATFNRERMILRDARLLQRYLREAQSRRNRAFRAWVGHLSDLWTPPR